MAPVTDIGDLAQRIAAGERRALARGITLIESSRTDHRDDATALLNALPQDRQALRVGLSGTPGVGKSTFIEAFGMMLTARGQSRDRDMAEKAGVSRFMPKPFSNSEVLTAVRDLLYVHQHKG